MPQNLTEIKRRSVKGVVSYGLRTAILYGVAVGATGLLGIYLTPAEFGVYFVVISLVGLFTFMSDIGLAAALIQKKTEPTTAELQTTFTVQQLLAMVIFLLIFILTPVWRRFNDFSQYGLELLYALGFSFILASFKTIPSILLERKLEFAKLVWPQLVEQVIFYGIAVYMAYQGFGVRSFTMAVVLRSIAGVAVISRLQSWPIGIRISREALKGLLSFGIKFQVNDLLARLKDDLYVVVLGWFIAPAQMGYLGWAKRWSMFPYQFSVSNVVSITFPTYSRLQDQRIFLQQAVEKSLYFISLVIFPILMGMSALAQAITLLVPEYEKWQPALPMLYFFCINIAFAAIANPIINTLNAIGKIDITLKIMAVMTVTTWVATPVAYAIWGMTGIAAVSAVVAGISMVAYVWLRQLMPVDIVKQIWGKVVASLVMGIGLLLMQHVWSQSWGYFFSGVGMGIFIYLTVLILIEQKRLVTEVQSLLKR